MRMTRSRTMKRHRLVMQATVFPRLAHIHDLQGRFEAEMHGSHCFASMAVAKHRNLTMAPEKLPSRRMMFNYRSHLCNLRLSLVQLLNGKVGNHVVLEVGGERNGHHFGLAVDTVRRRRPPNCSLFQARNRQPCCGMYAATDAMGVTQSIALKPMSVLKTKEPRYSAPSYGSATRRAGPIRTRYSVGSRSWTRLQGLSTLCSQPWPVWFPCAGLCLFQLMALLELNLRLMRGNLLYAGGDTIWPGRSVETECRRSPRGVRALLARSRR